MTTPTEMTQPLRAMLGAINLLAKAGVSAGHRERWSSRGAPVSKRVWLLLLGLCALVAVPFTAAAGTLAPGSTPPPPSYGVIERQNVPVRMSDGTVLSVNVYSPTDVTTGAPARGAFPVLLAQTPYGKDIGEGPNTYFVSHGYVEVVADVRGTGNSGGTYGLLDPIQGRDGAALVQWAARLPHSNGRVGLFNGSYLGINQFLTAGWLPPDSPLKAMFPIVAANDLYRDAWFQGGLFNSAFGGEYAGVQVASQMAEAPVESALTPDSLDPAAVAGKEAGHARGLTSYHAPFLHDALTGGPMSFDSRYWQVRSPEYYLSKVVAHHIPVFLVGGWHDLFQRGELLNYVALQNLSQGRPANAPMTPGQRPSPRYQLLMGPWEHQTVGTGIDLDALQLRWFDTWLKDRHTGLDTTSTPLHLNLLGSSTWVETKVWPPGGAAASRTAWLGDSGTLRLSPPRGVADTTLLTFTAASSPCSLQTSQWSSGVDNFALSSAGLGPDPCSQRSSAPPGATFTSVPMRTDTILTGPINASLVLSSSTPDCELLVSVDVISPSGTSTALTAGALLGSMRAIDKKRSWRGAHGVLLPYHPYTAASRKLMTRGRPTRLDVEVFPTFALLPTGSRLRVTISTADTPHLLPNAAQWPDLAGGRYQLVTNSLRGSRLELTLIPADT